MLLGLSPALLLQVEMPVVELLTLRCYQFCFYQLSNYFLVFGNMGSIAVLTFRCLLLCYAFARNPQNLVVLALHGL